MGSVTNSNLTDRETNQILVGWLLKRDGGL